MNRINHKIAYHIIAFEAPWRVLKTVQALWTEEDYFIIHWNPRSSKEHYVKLQKELSRYPNVFIYSKFSIRLGGDQTLLAQLDAMKLLSRKGIEYDHFISLTQSCYPIKTIAYIKEYLSHYKGNSLFKLRKNPPIAYKPEYPEGAYETIFYRRDYFYWLNPRSRAHGDPLTGGEKIRICFKILQEILRHPKIALKNFVRTIVSRPERGGGGKGHLLQSIKSMLNPRNLEKFVRHPAGYLSAYDKKLPKGIKPEQCQISNLACPMLILSRKHVEYLNARPPFFKILLKHVRWGFAPDEYFIKTVLYNTPFYNDEVVSVDNFANFLPELTALDFPVAINESVYNEKRDTNQRFIHGLFKANNHQMEVLPEELENILFMRKINDEDLINMIDNHSAPLPTPSPEVPIPSHNLVFFCKTYRSDLLAYIRMLKSYLQFNKDHIPLYVSVPQEDIPLFEEVSSHGEGVYIIADHSYRPWEERFPIQGWFDQQVCKLSFWRSGLCSHYFCIDSDLYFIKDFYTSDFMYNEDTPYTVLVMDKDLGVEPYYRQAWDYRQPLIKKIYETIGLEDPRLRTCHNSQVFSVKVLRSLYNDFIIPNKLSFKSLIKIAHYEFAWYNAWFQKCGLVKEIACEPFVKMFHYRIEYILAQQRGIREEDWARQYIGIILNGNWYPLPPPEKYEDPHRSDIKIYKKNLKR